MSSYKGRVYLAPSGQWAFKYYIDDQEAGGGAGFKSEKEAKLGCKDVLQGYVAKPKIVVVKYEELPPLV
ncbi:hypothetical protein ABS71_18850 [bacterium SCN 62-11]|nr:MAG: hypothetical protein ABS71_18850 [bacterium SCN 62-11]